MLKWCQNKKSENLLLDDTFLDLMVGYVAVIERLSLLC